MALVFSALGYASDLLSWAKKTLVEADTAAPNVVFEHEGDHLEFSFDADEGTSVDAVCDEGTSVDSLSWDDMDTVEELGEEVSSLELSCSSLFPTEQDVEMVDESCMALSPISISPEMWNGMNKEFYRVAFVNEKEEEPRSVDFGSVSFWSVVEDVEMEEENVMVSSFSSTLSTLHGADAEVLDDVEDEILRDGDAEIEEDFEVEISSMELSCTSLSSLTLTLDMPVLQTEGCVGVADGEEAELSLDSLSISLGDELEVCLPSVVSEPVVVTRSGRHSRRPDRYGDWLYY